MAALWQYLADGYYDIMENKSDPRLKDWFMMKGPLPTIILCIVYTLFVKVIGPKIMENRKPFGLRRTMIFYNAFQVVFSSWLVYTGLKNGWWNDYSFRCQPIDYSDSPKAIGMVRVCWWYLMSKFIEFLDTIFFVLRKKNNHISTLHVIHHGVIPFSTWLCIKFSPGGQASFFGLLNASVHVVMYGYYFLSAFGPKIQPYLWWKKYITTLQMLQFVLAAVHAAQLLFIDCDYPRFFVFYTCFHAIFFLILFRNFYVHTYNEKRD